MDTPGPTESRTRPIASRRRKRSVCCSSPAVRQRDHTHQPDRPRRPDEAGAGSRPVLDGSEVLVPSASDEDDTYHTADEDFEDAEESASTNYRGFTFRGPVPPSVSPQREDKPFGSTDMEWPLVAEMQQRLQDDGRYGTGAVNACFDAWGGEARCLLRILRGNFHIVDDAMKQLDSILEYRSKHNVDGLDPRDALSHPCKPFWVGEMVGFADQAHVKGCVIQVTVPRYVKPDVIVESFTQEQLDSFFILWMELRLARQRESIAQNVDGNNQDDRMLEIYDMAGLGFSQFHRRGLKMLSASIGLAQANYPEDLCQTYIVNAPRVFGAIWKVISLVLNERTKAKIQVSTGDFDGELAKLVGGQDRLDQILAAVQPAGT